MIEKERRAELRTFLASLAIAAALVIPVVLILPKAGDGYDERTTGEPVQQRPAHDPIVIVTWYLEAAPTRYVGPLSAQRERMMSCLRRPKLCTIEMRGG